MIKVLSQLDCVNSSHCFNVATILPDVLPISSTTGERQVEMNGKQMKSIYSRVMHANIQFGRDGEQASVVILACCAAICT